MSRFLATRSRVAFALASAWPRRPAWPPAQPSPRARLFYTRRRAFRPTAPQRRKSDRFSSYVLRVSKRAEQDAVLDETGKKGAQRVNERSIDLCSFASGHATDD